MSEPSATATRNLPLAASVGLPGTPPAAAARMHGSQCAGRTHPIVAVDAPDVRSALLAGDLRSDWPAERLYSSTALRSRLTLMGVTSGWASLIVSMRSEQCGRSPHVRSRRCVRAASSSDSSLPLKSDVNNGVGEKVRGVGGKYGWGGEGGWGGPVRLKPLVELVVGAHVALCRHQRLPVIASGNNNLLH